MSDLRALLAEVERYTDDGAAGRRRGPEYALFSALVEEVERLRSAPRSPGGAGGGGGQGPVYKLVPGFLRVTRHGNRGDA